MQETIGDLKLKKIELHDSPPDITVINPNWDKLDTEITGMKSQKADKTYVDQKVSDLVDSAPEALDTLKELSTALGNDPNFATTVATQIGQKVDKETGKGLSTNDYTTAEKNKLAGVATNANNYTHPTTAGNKHIPSGGKADDVLMWSADGTAVWGEAGGAMLQEGSTLRLVNPKGASLNTVETQTGLIKIKLPQSWTSTMMKMKIEVYNYATNESFSVLCGGYNFSGEGGKWYNPFAQIISSNGNKDLPIRFGHDGTKCCITIGEVNSTWSYLKVAVTEFFAGANSATSSSWKGGWSVSLETALPTTVNHTLTNNLIASDFNKLKNKTNATQSVSGLMSNTDKTKLDSVAVGANNYVHPNDANTRHVTDAEKTTWNGKLDKTGGTITGEVSMTSSATPLTLVRNGSPNLNICFNNGTSGNSGVRYLGTYGGTSLRFGTSADLGSGYEIYHTGNKPTPSDIGAVKAEPTQLVSGQDLNSINTLGFYASSVTNICASLLNKPSDMYAGELGLEVTSAGSELHLIQHLITKNGIGNVKKYYRVKSNSTWGSWIRIYDTNNKPIKADVGLSNVDNTSDANKPISTATQTALNLKADKTHIADMTTHITASERTSWNGKLNSSNPSMTGSLTIDSQVKIFKETGLLSSGSDAVVRQEQGNIWSELRVSDGNNDSEYNGVGITNRYSINGGTAWNYLLKATFGELSYKGNKIYHAGNKPTASEVGAEPTFTKNTAFNKNFGGNGSATTVSRSDHTHSYLPLTGGTMTSNIAFNMHGSTQTPIKIYGGKADGQGISIGAGATTIISSGEGKAQIEANLVATSETMVVGSDGQIEFYTALQNGWASRKAMVMGADGRLTNNQGFVGNLVGNASTATKLQTPRTINGVNFDGTANITVADSTKLPLTGGTLTGALSVDRIGVSNSSPTTGKGISLYEGATSGKPSYGLMFAGTGTFGTHGTVTGDWATYLTMTGATNRGWIFKHGDSNVASIGSDGTASFSTVRGNQFTSDNGATTIAIRDNEVNFGGTGGSSSVFFGYRATGSRPIPSLFVFGGSTGTASLKASCFDSTVAQGTAPFTVASNTVVSKLNSDLLDGLHSSSFLRSDTSNNYDMRFSSTNGRGMRFWDSDSYKIYMSSATDSTWGGRMTGDTTSDYNMYFKMEGETKKGFVFKTKIGNAFGITPDGDIQAKGNVSLGDNKVQMKYNSTTESLDFIFV